MNLTKALETFEKVYSQRARPLADNEPTCDSYRGGAGNDFCRHTTQTSCFGCRAYMPDGVGKRILLANEIAEQWEKNDSLRNENLRLEISCKHLEWELKVAAIRLSLGLKRKHFMTCRGRKYGS